MRNKGFFHFKQFNVAHDRSTHKIGTDGVLLGAWVNVSGAQYILDIGTGTGVIALMMTQRTAGTAVIDAVEIEKEDSEQAMENVQQSPWPGKVKVHHTAIQDFYPSRQYDLVVSNPPYFINSWKPPEKRRSQARHTHGLSFNELLQAASRLLTTNGRLAVILPYQEALHFTELAKQYQLYVIRRMTFRSRAHKPVERLLIEFGGYAVEVKEEELVLHGEGDQWSEAYCRLTREFYLNI
jgi:tRNA1Val (adenine37-N6)-methyltransferase